jgi:hypothetical protein
MNKTFELIWKTIARPKEAFNEIREEKPVYAALIYLLIYGIVSVIASHFVSQTAFSGSQNLGNLPQEIQPFMKDFFSSLKGITSSTPFFIIGLIVPYINVFLSVALYELIAQFATKRANGVALFTAWSFASIPLLIYKLLILLFAVSMNYTLPFWIELIFMLWGITLYIIVIKETYQTDTGIAIGIYFTPVIAVLVIAILYVALLVPALSGILKLIPKGAITP